MLAAHTQAALMHDSATSSYSMASQTLPFFWKYTVEKFLLAKQFPSRIISVHQPCLSFSDKPFKPHFSQFPLTWETYRDSNLGS